MITVIAGVNGAGKSSVVGSYLRGQGGEYFNPDEVSRKLMEEDVALSQQEANSRAWSMGFKSLKNAIAFDTDFAFETTLGGESITHALHEAIDRGRIVKIIFCGLNSPELHIQRVAQRTQKGGHDIPAVKIRERFEKARINLAGLIPRCQTILVYDNSDEMASEQPRARRLFLLHRKRLDFIASDIPEWAKPLASVAIKTSLGECQDAPSTLPPKG